MEQVLKLIEIAKNKRLNYPSKKNVSKFEIREVFAGSQPHDVLERYYKEITSLCLTKK